jgi:hypothetical protein
MELSKRNKIIGDLNILSYKTGKVRIGGQTFFSEKSEISGPGSFV